MVDLDYWGDLAQNAFLQTMPSTQLANRLLEPYKGLPFGPYLHTTRPRRQRNLTAPLPNDRNDGVWHLIPLLSAPEPTQQTVEQLQSAFLSRLPLDIRIIIYEKVLGEMVFHMSATGPKSRILLYICNRPERIGDQAHECHELSANTKRPSLAPWEDSRVATGLLPLLVTCRKTYSEAIKTLYSANAFEFRQNSAAFRFLKIMIQPQRLRSIRHFRWHMRIPHHPNINARSRRDWNGLFEFFASEMSGLQSLFLQLQMMQPTEAEIMNTADADGADWVQPMVSMAVEAKKSRGCKFEVATGGEMHDCAKILKEVAQENLGISFGEILLLACTAVHKRIRLSLEIRE